MSEKSKIDGKSLLVALICVLIFFIGAFYISSTNKEETIEAEDYAEYENGKVIAVLSDNTIIDEQSDNAYRGEQLLTVKITTGQYKGQEMLTYNYIGPLYGIPLEAGDGVTVIISTFSDGRLSCTVYEYNHIPGLLILVALFAIATVLIGGKNGARSLISLVFTLLCIFFILIPALLRGAPTISLTFLICVLISAFSFTVNSGFGKKTVCAFLGTIAGVGLALLFAFFAQWLLRVDGLRLEQIEALLQLRRTTGIAIGLRGLLSASIVISTLGAEMDVAMGLASAISEVHDANDKLSLKELFISGTNIGKDMVGTMTSTLILAFLGSSFILMMYLYSMNLGKYQLLSSAFISTEVISALACSVGVILSIPITNYITAKAFAPKE